MRGERLRCLLLLPLLLIEEACGSGSTNPGNPCGPGGACPTGFTCDPTSNHCVASAGGEQPTTMLGDTPDALTHDASATFTFTADLAGATFECALDGGAFVPCSSPDTVTVEDGDHTFAVRAVKDGVADPAPPSYSWTVDTTPPDTAIASGPTGKVVLPEVSFTFTSSEDGSTFECRIDDGAFAECTSGQETFSGLAAGDHTFAVRAIDAAGNVDPTPATDTFTIVPPDTEITQGPPSSTTSRVASFTFRSDTEGVTFECALDGAAFAACTSPASYTDLAVGSHTFEVRASLGDLTDPSPASAAWTIAQTSLDTVITSGAENGYSGTDVTFTYVSPNAAGFECALDSNAFASCPSTGKTYTGLEEGSEHTFQVRAVGAAGERGPAASRSFIVDTTPPTVMIASPADGSIVGIETPFTFSVQDGEASGCTLDDAPIEGCASGMTLTLADGPHSVTVTAVDAAGNSATAQASFTVDGVAPVVTITFPLEGAGAPLSTRIRYDAGDSVSTTCTFDGQPLTCGLASVGVTTTEGSHTFTVQGTDAVGNVSEVATRTYYADGSPPLVTDVTVVDVPNEPDGTATLSFTLSDASDVATIYCRVDDQPFADCGSGGGGSITFQSLAAGDHKFEIYGVDEWGQSGAQEATGDPPSAHVLFPFFELYTECTTCTDCGAVTSPCHAGACEPCVTTADCCQPYQCFYGECVVY